MVGAPATAVEPSWRGIPSAMTHAQLSCLRRLCNCLRAGADAARHLSLAALADAGVAPIVSTWDVLPWLTVGNSRRTATRDETVAAMNAILQQVRPCDECTCSPYTSAVGRGGVHRRAARASMDVHDIEVSGAAASHDVVLSFAALVLSGQTKRLASQFHGWSVLASKAQRGGAAPAAGGAGAGRVAAPRASPRPRDAVPTRTVRASAAAASARATSSGASTTGDASVLGTLTDAVSQVRRANALRAAVRAINALLRQEGCADHALTLRDALTGFQDTRSGTVWGLSAKQRWTLLGAARRVREADPLILPIFFQTPLLHATLNPLAIRRAMHAMARKAMEDDGVGGEAPKFSLYAERVLPLVAISGKFHKPMLEYHSKMRKLHARSVVNPFLGDVDKPLPPPTAGAAHALPHPDEVYRWVHRRATCVYAVSVLRNTLAVADTGKAVTNVLQVMHMSKAQMIVLMTWALNPRAYAIAGVSTDLCPLSVLDARALHEGKQADFFVPRDKVSPAYLHAFFVAYHNMRSDFSATGTVSQISMRAAGGERAANVWPGAGRQGQGRHGQGSCARHC